MEAARHIERALEMDPGNPKALANSALGKLILREHEEAMRQALQALRIQPDQETALSVLIHALASLGRFDALGDDVRIRAEQYSGGRRALAMFCAASGDNEKAERLFRQNIESGACSPQDQALLAQLLAGATQEKLRWLQLPPWRIPEQDRRRLREAEKLATDAAAAWS